MVTGEYVVENTVIRWLSRKQGINEIQTREENMTENSVRTAPQRCDFVKKLALTSADWGAALPDFSLTLRQEGPVPGSTGAGCGKPQDGIHPVAAAMVSAAWSKGIEEVLKYQQTVHYQSLDGQNKVVVQVSLTEYSTTRHRRHISASDQQCCCWAPRSRARQMSWHLEQRTKGQKTRPSRMLTASSTV